MLSSLLLLVLLAGYIVIIPLVIISSFSTINIRCQNVSVMEIINPSQTTSLHGTDNMGGFIFFLNVTAPTPVGYNTLSYQIVQKNTTKLRWFCSCTQNAVIFFCTPGRKISIHKNTWICLCWRNWWKYPRSKVSYIIIDCFRGIFTLGTSKRSNDKKIWNKKLNIIFILKKKSLTIGNFVRIKLLQYISHFPSPS